MKSPLPNNFELAEETLYQVKTIIDEIHALCCLVELARFAEREGIDMCGYDRDSYDPAIFRRIHLLAAQCHEDIEVYRGKLLDVA